LSRQYPDGRFRVLAALSDGDASIGLAEIHSQRLEAPPDMRAESKIVTEFISDPTEGDEADAVIS
jgi:hypothetical protein